MIRCSNVHRNFVMLSGRYFEYYKNWKLKPLQCFIDEYSHTQANSKIQNKCVIKY